MIMRIAVKRTIPFLGTCALLLAACDMSNPENNAPSGTPDGPGGGRRREAVRPGKGYRPELGAERHCGPGQNQGDGPGGEYRRCQ